MWCNLWGAGGGGVQDLLTAVACSNCYHRGFASFPTDLLFLQVILSVEDIA